MIKKIRYLLLGTWILMITLTSSGCVWLAVGAAAGAGTYAWVSGVLQKDFMVSAEELQKATREAMRDLSMVTKEESEDRLSAVYKLTLADGSNISINIEALTERSARIRIRVGIFGDQTKSEMVLSAIEQRL